MAIGFGATQGVGSADRIVGPSFSLPNQYTIMIRSYRSGEGGSNFGRMFQHGNLSLLMNNQGFAADTYSIIPTLANTPRWEWTRPSANVWSNISISLDRSSSSNDPVVYQDGVKPTLTQQGADAAFPGSTASGCIGNRTSDNARGWDGILADFAFYDAILTDDEHYAFNRGVSPLLIRPESLRHYVPMVRNGSIDMVDGNWTVTGTAARPHPRIFGRRRNNIVVVPSSFAQTLLPALFTNNNNFYSHVLSQSGSSQTLLAQLFINSNQFYNHTLAPGVIILQPDLYSNTSTFFAATITPAVKGVNITLYDSNNIPLANLTNCQVVWYDESEPKDFTTVVYKTSLESTDASGVLKVDLDTVTSLAFGQNGFLIFYKLDEIDHKDSLVFAGQVPISPI